MKKVTFLQLQKDRYVAELIRKEVKKELAEKIKKIPNVIVKTKKGNMETKIELKAKFTKDLLELLK